MPRRRAAAILCRPQRRAAQHDEERPDTGSKRWFHAAGAGYSSPLRHRRGRPVLGQSERVVAPARPPARGSVMKTVPGRRFALMTMGLGMVAGPTGFAAVRDGVANAAEPSLPPPD